MILWAKDVIDFAQIESHRSELCLDIVVIRSDVFNLSTDLVQSNSFQIARSWSSIDLYNVRQHHIEAANVQAFFYGGDM